MKDPHKPLPRMYPDVDLAERVPRSAEWDKDTLDDYPTDDIMPVSLTDTSELAYDMPYSPGSICMVYSRWLYEICKKTAETSYEHACRTDGYGNIYGVIEDASKDEHGHKYISDRRIEESDYQIHNQTFFHVHPRGKAMPEIASGNPGGFSYDDLNVMLEDYPPYGTMAFIPMINKLIPTKVFILYVFENEQQKSNNLPDTCYGEPDKILEKYNEELTEVSQHMLANAKYAEPNQTMIDDIEDDLTVMRGAIENGERPFGLGVMPIRFEQEYAVPSKGIIFDTPILD